MNQKQDSKNYYYVEKIIDTEDFSFVNYIITEERYIVDAEHLDDTIRDMLVETVKDDRENQPHYYPFANEDEAEGVRIYEIDKDGSLYHIFTATGAYSDDKERYVIKFSNHRNQWSFTEYDESENTYHSMVDMKKYAQELCDYVGLELKYVIEDYDGDWNEVIFYLERCRDMREIQEMEMHQEFYGI